MMNMAAGNKCRSEAQPIVVNEFTQYVGPRVSVGGILEVFLY